MTMKRKIIIQVDVYPKYILNHAQAVFLREKLVKRVKNFNKNLKRESEGLYATYASIKITTETEKSI